MAIGGHLVPVIVHRGMYCKLRQRDDDRGANPTERKLFLLMVEEFFELLSHHNNIVCEPNVDDQERDVVDPAGDSQRVSTYTMPRIQRMENEERDQAQNYHRVRFLHLLGLLYLVDDEIGVFPARLELNLYPLEPKQEHLVEVASCACDVCARNAQLLSIAPPLSIILWSPVAFFFPY